MKRPSFLFVFFVLCASSGLQAQFFKIELQPHTIPVTIPHPPEFNMTVKRVAFGGISGPCSDMLADKIQNVFISNNVEVIDREHLNQIMAEHNFQTSDYADPRTASHLGKIVGAAALVFVRVDECNPERTHLNNTQNLFNGQTQTTFISKTRISLEASIQTDDLTTGKVMEAKTLKSAPDQEASSPQGYPEFPPVDVVRDTAMQSVAQQVYQLFFPWTQQVQLPFYSDKDCGLREEFDLFKRGDHEGALKLSLSNLDQCKAGRKTKEKTLARAYYDAGVAYFAAGDYQDAQTYLHQAMESKGADAVAQAASAVGQAQSGAEEVAAYRKRAAQVPAPSPIPMGPPSASAAPVNPGPPPATVQPQAVNAASGSTPKLSVEQRLKQLDELLKKGLITRKDYDAKKAEILKSL